MKWILVTDVLAVVETDLKNAWLFPNTKSAEKKAKELIKKDSRERRTVVNIAESKFEVKIKDGEVFIALQINESNNTEFYLIKNFDNSLILELIEACDIRQGMFMGLLELGYNCEDGENNKIGLLHEKMKSYDGAITEMARKIFCTKKTKKRVVGHRYDSGNQILTYLGTLYVNKFEENADLEPVYLYTKNIKDCTKLSDVLKTQQMGCEGNLIILPADKVPPMIDCGKVLEEDIRLDSDWIVEMVKCGKNLQGKILPLCYKVNPDDDPVKLPEEVKTDINKNLFDTGMKTYITRRGAINSVEIKDDADKNSIRLFNLKRELCIDLSMGGYLIIEGLCVGFYEKLLKSLEINMDEVLTTVLEFDVESITRDFELYKKYSDYYFKLTFPTVDLIIYLLNNQSKDEINLLHYIKSSYSTAIISEEDVREASELFRNFIIVVNDTRNISKLIHHYHRYNEGTAAKPSYFTQMKFNMSDVIRWAEENQLMTDNIKHFILESKLRNFYLEFKDNTNIIL